MDLLTKILDITIQVIIENTGTVIAFVVTTILAIIGAYYAAKGAYYTAKAYFLSKQEAEKAPRIQISLYNQNAEDGVYFVLPFKPHRKFVIPLRLTIKNEGSLSAKDV